MTVEELVDKLADGELDAETFNEALEKAAEAEAKAAAEKAAPAELERIVVREEVRVVDTDRAELSRESQRELEESRERIKKAASKARHI
jgi:hypothetical protein